MKGKGLKGKKDCHIYNDGKVGDSFSYPFVIDWRVVVHSD